MPEGERKGFEDRSADQRGRQPALQLVYYNWIRSHTSLSNWVSPPGDKMLPDIA